MNEDGEVSIHSQLLKKIYIILIFHYQNNVINYCSLNCLNMLRCTHFKSLEHILKSNKPKFKKQTL